MSLVGALMNLNHFFLLDTADILNTSDVHFSASLGYVSDTLSWNASGSALRQAFYGDFTFGGPIPNNETSPTVQSELLN